MQYYNGFKRMVWGGGFRLDLHGSEPYTLKNVLETQ
jgi:hypothetical protein